MSVIVQSAPYALRDGPWDDGREALGDRVVADARRATRPASAGLVAARQVLTPLDLERDYGLTGGHPMHGEHGLDQFFLWRPLLGHARYRLPLEGLYLAAPGRTRAAASPAGPARTPPARSSRTSGSAAARAAASRRGRAGTMLERRPTRRGRSAGTTSMTT